MKNLKIATTFISAIMLTAVVGCAATPERQSTGQYVDDAVITTSIKKAIFQEPTLKVAEINVETFKGDVQLSGFVNSKEDINTAVRVAGAVNGVKSIKNDMRMK
jgi:osmotically-inducible protein OsmY